MRPLAILAAAIVALWVLVGYLLGRDVDRTRAMLADVDDVDWLGEFRSPTNTITLAYPTNPAATWRN